MQILEAIQQINDVVNEIKQDLDRYSEQENAKAFIIKKLNSQISKLEFSNNLITDFLTQQKDQEQKTAQAAKKRTEHVEKLELICLLHGIFDLSYYLSIKHYILKTMVQNKLNPKADIRGYIKIKLNPKLEDLILSIEQLQRIKTIQKPIGLILAEGEKPAYLGTTNKPITSFK